MCIICIKKKGVQFPSYDVVKNMCDNNDDGFSLVLSNGKGKPTINKGLNKNKFLSFYKKVIASYDYKTTSMFIHARIKTHGTMRIENCHGWKENGLIFAHNGILSIDNRDDMTDSETFFRDIFSPIYKHCGWKAAKKAIDAVIGTSKFVFMTNSGDIIHFGNYIEDDGLLYSNTTYKPYTYPRYTGYAGSSYYKSGSGGGYHWGDTKPISKSVCDDSWIDDYYDNLTDYEKKLYGF